MNQTPNSTPGIRLVDIMSSLFNIEEETSYFYDHNISTELITIQRLCTVKCQVAK